ncbi:MAG: hypothetical protein V1860_01610 [bacterium]
MNIPNLNKIKKEFKSAKRSFIIFSCAIILILILFIAAAAGLFMYAAADNNSLLNDLPDDMAAMEYFLKIKDEKINLIYKNLITDNFAIELSDAPIINFNEAAVIFIQEEGNNRPVLILNPDKNAGDIILWAKKNNITSEYLNKKIILLTRYPEILKYFKKEPFLYAKTLKKFQQKNKFSALIFFDFTKLKASENLVENSIIEGVAKAENRILIGIKKDKSYDYNVKTASIAGKEFMTFKITASPSRENVFIPANDDKNTIMSYRFFNNNAFAEKLSLPVKDGEFILIDNHERSVEESYNPLMLDGDRSAYFYILILKNNSENKKNLENIKNSSISYIDKNIQEERISELPDGTYMTEIWSNPKRFSFSPNDNNIFSLAAENLNFEIAYSENENYIFIGNSKIALSDFIKSRPGYHRNDTNTENFYLNTDYIKDTPALGILNMFGKYVTGEILP